MNSDFMVLHSRFNKDYEFLLKKSDVQSVYFEGDKLYIDMGQYDGNRFCVVESIDEVKAMLFGDM